VNAPRVLTTALLAGAAAFSLSCGEQTPLGVSPQQDLLGTLTGTVTETLSKTVESLTLLRCEPMPPANATKWVGPRGGTINVGPHRLTIPDGALGGWVKISATAPSDTVNRVHFEPEGLQFKKYASLTMSYANCGLVDWLLPKQIVYTSGDLDILEVLKSFDLPLDEEVTGKLKHFSEYAVAW
jgi:hypothetical protein